MQCWTDTRVTSVYLVIHHYVGLQPDHLVNPCKKSIVDLYICNSDIYSFYVSETETCHTPWPLCKRYVQYFLIFVTIPAYDIHILANVDI